MFCIKVKSAHSIWNKTLYFESSNEDKDLSLYKAVQKTFKKRFYIYKNENLYAHFQNNEIEFKGAIYKYTPKSLDFKGGEKEFLNKENNDSLVFHFDQKNNNFPSLPEGKEFKSINTFIFNGVTVYFSEIRDSGVEFLNLSGKKMEVIAWVEQGVEETELDFLIMLSSYYWEYCLFMRTFELP